jgi:integrase
MGTIYQRRAGGIYYGYWSDAKGRHFRQSLRTKDPQVARARLRQLELVSTDPATHGRHSLDEAIANLLDVVERGNSPGTYRSYRQKARHLRRVLGDVELADITRDNVVVYMRQRKLERASDSTVHKELVVLRRALLEARERGLWRGEPGTIVPTIKVTYHPRERWLTPDQAELLIREVPRHRRLWIALALFASGSLSEVEATKVEHVDLKAKRLRVPGRKRSTRWRLVPIHPSLLPLLRNAVKNRDAGESLVKRWPNVRRDLHAAVVRVNTKIAALESKRKPAPLPKVSPNDLRRTFASWLKQAGEDSLVVAHLMGHSSTRMVELVYGRLADETYQDAVAAMPKLKRAI